jgi:hypothetical protein
MKNWFNLKSKSGMDIISYFKWRSGYKSSDTKASFLYDKFYYLSNFFRYKIHYKSFGGRYVYFICG